MPKMYRVTVDPSYRWSVVFVGGKHFAKATVYEMQESDLTDEMMSSPLLSIEEVKTRGRPRSRPKPEPEEED